MTGDPAPNFETDEEHRKAHALEALRRFGSICAAARALGITRNTLKAWMTRWALQAQMQDRLLRNSPPDSSETAV